MKDETKYDLQFLARKLSGVDTMENIAKILGMNKSYLSRVLNGNLINHRLLNRLLEIHNAPIKLPSGIETRPLQLTAEDLIIKK